MKYQVLLVLLVVLVFYACEEAFVFDTYNDPVTTFNFIDADSINQLDSLSKNNQTIVDQLKVALSSLDSSLQAIEESLQVIDVARDSGNFSFDSLRNELIALFSMDSLQALVIENRISDLDFEIDSLLLIQNELNQGILLLDYVIPQFGVDTTVTFTDSTDAYLLPLNITNIESTFLIGVANEAYILNLLHENQEVLSADLGILIQIRNIRLGQTSFDSVRINCGNSSNCTPNGTTIICYY